MGSPRAPSPRRGGRRERGHRHPPASLARAAAACAVTAPRAADARAPRPGWTLARAGEPEAPVDFADHDPDARAALVRADGLDRALVAPSTPLGIEALPAGEAEPLLAAYHEGVRALPDAVRRLGRGRPRRARSRGRWRELLDQGFVGACVAAEALGAPTAGAARPGARDARAPRRAAARPSGAGTPRRRRRAARWWAALTGYVATMQAAWLRVRRLGRAAHPGLRVCFAMLAGLAPLQRERLARSRRARDHAIRRLPRRLLLRRARRRRGAARGRRRQLSSTAPTVPSSPPPSCPLGDAVPTALRERNPARLLAPPRRSPHDHVPRPRPAPARSRLARASLRELVEPHRRRPGAGAAAVRHDTPERHFEQLWRDDHVDVWVITWTGEQRHRLPRPRRLARRRRRRAGRAHRGAPRGGRPAAPAAPPAGVRSRRPTSTASGASDARPSRSTPTRRRCGGWAPTRSRPTAPWSARASRRATSCAPRPSRTPPRPEGREIDEQTRRGTRLHRLGGRRKAKGYADGFEGGLHGPSGAPDQVGDGVGDPRSCASAGGIPS